MRRLKQLLVAGVTGAMLLIGRGVARADEPTKEGLEFFEKNIRPVLADSCYKCHSEAAKEKKKLKAKLYLDSWAGMAKGGESGDPAVVPGDPEKSVMIKAIRYKATGDDEDQNMPPKQKDGSGGKLPDETIKKFEEWIKMGAPYPKGDKAQGPASPADKTHWAFVPPAEPTIPAVKESGRVQNPIDAFVMSKLEEKGLKLNPPADKRTLIRRATIDLTGVPPTPAEVDSFLQDNSPEAFGKVVDRLLASPRYGERWGRHWLDIARYSDTKGYVFQEERRYPFAFTYRDWVVGAFNSDLPYDQFLIDQIAADKLDLGDNKQPLAAMGFLTLGRRFLNQTADIIDDRLDVICRGTMALTIGCARCHDHKFDPIPTKDYYSLYGVLDSSMEPKELPLLAQPATTPASLAFEKELKAREAAVEAYKQQKAETVLAHARKPETIAEYLLAAHLDNREAGDAKDDLNHYLLLRYRAILGSVTAEDPVFGPWKAYAALPAGEFTAKAPQITDQLFGADAKHSSSPLVIASFAGKPPSSLKDVAERYGELLGKVAGPDKRAHPDEETLRLTLYGDGRPLAVPASDYVRLFKRDGHEQLTLLQKKVDEWIASSAAAPARAMVMMDSPSPHDAAIHIRGSVSNLGPAVPRHFLTVLSHGGTPTPLNEGSGRLQLARAIASRDNPLTARVLVNRVWLYHFGKGIVRTPSDFGTRCDPPTHPELLDWLALRFMDNGWSIKKLHKLILTSAAYQQSSDDNAEARKIDPDNLLLWKMNRQRMDFESTRDSLLATAGTLDETIGGRAVSLADPANSRRTIYASIDRQNLPPLFRAFDFASPDTTSPQRFTTTVPQQALFFMNSPFVIRQARALAERPDVAPADPEARVRQLYRLLFAREATPEEVSAGLQYVDAESAAPAADPVWQYGYGRFDASTQRVADFTALPYFTGSAWQGGPQLPDPKLGWVLLTPGGGHPGDDSSHAGIRRWTAPASTTIRIVGTLEHSAEQGDGVRARIVSSRSGVLGEWSIHHGSVRTNIANVKVQQGDTIDFVVDCRDNVNSDSYAWGPVIHAAAGAAWSASADFSGAPASKLSPWEKYVQVLMESNEFVFVD